MAEGTFTVSSGFGVRGGEQHRGIDMAAPTGTPIYAALDGRVTAAGSAQGFGNWIVVDSTTADGAVSTVYGHMYDDGVLVRQGDVVKAGQHIANVGSNGQSSGPHLHFELWQGGRLAGGRAVDPQPMLRKSKPSDNSVLAVANSIVDCAVKPGGKGLKTEKIPAEFVPWLLEGAKVCAGVTAPLLAAQLKAENNFRHGPTAPVSSTGAMGPAQFMPGTWAQWQLDADRNGTADVNSIADAVVAQAHFMCKLWTDSDAGVRGGTLKGDPVDLALAGYNAGFGAVQQAGGMPSGGDYTTQTQPYVKKIRTFERELALQDWTGTPDTPGQPQLPHNDDKTLAAARHYLDTEYVWGGGNTKGPTRGGFDGPGLSSYVLYTATDGKVTLPRTAQKQWSVGSEVPVHQLRPGDLVFSDWDEFGKPRKVAVAIGGGRVVHASAAGAKVVEDAVAADAKGRRVA